MARTGCSSTSFAYKIKLAMFSRMCQNHERRYDFKCALIMKMIHYFEFVWNNNTVKALSTSIQNSKMLLLSGLLFQEVFPFNKPDLLNFSRNVLREFYQTHRVLFKRLFPLVHFDLSLITDAR